MKPTLSSSASLKPAAKTKLYIRLKTVDLLQWPEREVAGLVKKLEEDPVFQKLLGMEGGEIRVVQRQRYPSTALARNFLELKEGAVPGGASMDVQKALAGREEIVALIRSIGPENFERYFIRQEGAPSLPDMASACGISEAQARGVLDFLLEFSAQAEFFHPSALSLSASVRPQCLGRIEGDAAGGFILAFFSPHLARGRYRIDYDSWEKLRTRKVLLPAEQRRAAALLRQAELLNLRFDNFHRVLQEALDVEKAYLQTGRREKKRVLSLRETSRRLGVASSTVCRLVGGRSVVLPWGEEVLLAGLFPQKKEVIRDILREKSEEIGRSGDGDVQRYLWQNFQLRVPRRTVNYWRHRLTDEGGR